MKRPITAMAIIMVVLVLGGCSTVSESTPTVAPVALTPTVDGSADLACGHFRDIMRDVSDGILTDAELRTKIREVYNTARSSENAGIAEYAKAMLSTITQGDIPGFTTVIGQFAAACNEIGV